MSIESCLDVARKRAFPLYGATLREFPGPMPPGLLALYGAHESGWRRWKTTTYPEAGPVMLTLKIGDDECKRHNVDPFDVRASIWGVQEAFAGWIPRLDAELYARQKWPFSSFDVTTQLWCLWMPRSIGFGALRNVLRGVGEIAHPEKFETEARIWIITAQAAACNWGAQRYDRARKRVAFAFDAIRAVQQAHINDHNYPGIPDSIERPKPRPTGLIRCPANLRANLSMLSARAKQDGDKTTGSW